MSKQSLLERVKIPVQIELARSLVSEKALLFAFWLFSVAKITSMMVVDDPDLWGKITYGLKELSIGSLLRVDPYSYTAIGANWINHEWLSEILFALAWKNSGSMGLWAIRVILVGAMLGIIVMLIIETTKGIWAGLLVYMVCWYEMARGFAIRAQLFTYLFFALLLFLIYRIYIQRSWSPWWALVFGPIMGVWANFHGGFLVGLGLLSWLAVYALVEWLYGRMNRRGLFLTFFGLALSYAATPVNPYGVDLWTWLIKSLSVSRGERIPEWATMHSFQPQLAVIGFYVAVALSVFLFIAIKKKGGFFEWGLMLALCLGAWMNNRHGVLFCTATAVILPKHIESLFPKLATPRGFHRSFVWAVVALSAIFAVGIHLLPGHQPTVMLVETGKHPYNAIKFIHDNNLRGNLLVWFNWAQSAIWYLHDRCKVAFDGRYDDVYPKKVRDDYFHFNNLDDQWENMIDRYNTQMILMPSNWPGVALLEGRGDWQLVYRSINATGLENNQQGEKAVLFIRRGVFPDFEAKLKSGGLISPTARIVFQFGEPLTSSQAEASSTRIQQ